ARGRRAVFRPRPAGAILARREPCRDSLVCACGKENPLADAGERELIDALRRKDMAALELVLERFGGAMATLARSMLRDATDAQDVVEESLVRVHEAGPRFRGERGVRTWVLRITANLCRDRLRRRRLTAGPPDGPAPLAEPGPRLAPGGDCG